MKIKTRALSLFLLALTASACGTETSPDVAPPPAEIAAPAPSADTRDALDARDVRDALGRPGYLVSLRPEALGKTRIPAEIDARFAAYHAPPAVALVRAVERDHGVEAKGMISLVGLAFLTHLTAEQAAALAADPRVESVDRDQRVELSAAVWGDQPASNIADFQSWGVRAVGTVDKSAIKEKKRTRVYILDGGVEPHPELFLVQSINALNPAGPALPGCYPHPTHVAGIVGARANGTGTRGVAAGVDLISVSALNPTVVDSVHGCLPPDTLTRDNIIMGLDWIAQDVIGRDRAGIVNLSTNGDAFSTAPFLDAVAHAATPRVGYPGVLVVQSAGNHVRDACLDAYGPARADDGVLVVGAINDHGQPVPSLNGANAFQNGSLAGSEPGSNFGSCVEVWAPGQRIYSTWSGGGYAYLSGTSMSAPHVAGLAAAIEVAGQTSIQLETAVRAKLRDLGSRLPADPGAPILMPSIAPAPAGGVYSTPYGEALFTQIGQFHPATPNNLLRLFDGESAELRLGSIGAGAAGCDVLRRSNGGAWTNIATATPSFAQSQVWYEGTWELGSTRCPYAHATLLVGRRPVWSLDGQPQVDSSTVSRPVGTPLTFDIGGATSCRLDAYHRYLDSLNIQRQDQLPGFAFTTSASTVLPLPATAGDYFYEAKCEGTDGSARIFTITITVTATAAPAIDPVAGSWWNPARSGNGFDLRVVDAGTLYLAWFTYTPAGSPIWYLGFLDRHPGQWQGSLNRYTWNGSSATSSVVGSATLTLGSASAGTFAWQLGAQSGSEPLQRYVFGSGLLVPPLSGWWYQPGQSGWGVMYDTQGSTHIATLTAYDASGNPTWIYGSADGTGSTSTFDMYRTSSTTLCPGCGGNPSVSVTYTGTITSALTQLSSGVSTTTIDATLTGGSWQRTAIDLVRLVGP